MFFSEKTELNNYNLIHLFFKSSVDANAYTEVSLF